MALSRSMKNLMHDSAMARRGGGTHNPNGGDVSGMLGRTMQKARGTKPTPGGTRGPRGPVVPGRGRRNPTTGGPGGPVLRPGGPGTVAGKPMPRAGTFGFAARGGGGTPALQEATAAARSQTMRQAAARGAAPRPAGAVPGGVAGAAGRARAAGPAALAQPRGQTTAQRIGGRQGPPARRGGMARALGSGGSRRRMLR